MTVAQITKCIADIGNYEVNKMIPFSEVSSIYLTLDHCLYPGKNTWVEFYTENDHNLLLVFDGSTDSDGNFTPDSTLPTYYIDGNTIAGFTLVSKTHMPEPYTASEAV